jgi:hypothetical protein
LAYSQVTLVARHPPQVIDVAQPVVPLMEAEQLVMSRVHRPS